MIISMQRLKWGATHIGEIVGHKDAEAPVTVEGERFALEWEGSALESERSALSILGFALEGDSSALGSDSLREARRAER